MKKMKNKKQIIGSTIGTSVMVASTLVAPILYDQYKGVNTNPVDKPEHELMDEQADVIAITSISQNGVSQDVTTSSITLTVSKDYTSYGLKATDVYFETNDGRNILVSSISVTTNSITLDIQMTGDNWWKNATEAYFTTKLKNLVFDDNASILLYRERNSIWMSPLKQIGGEDAKLDSSQIKLKLSGIDLGSQINSAFSLHTSFGTFSLNNCAYNKATNEYTLVTQNLETHWNNGEVVTVSCAVGGFNIYNNNQTVELFKRIVSYLTFDYFELDKGSTGWGTAGKYIFFGSNTWRTQEGWDEFTSIYNADVDGISFEVWVLNGQRNPTWMKCNKGTWELNFQRDMQGHIIQYGEIRFWFNFESDGMTQGYTTDAYIKIITDRVVVTSTNKDFLVQSDNTIHFKVVKIYYDDHEI